MTRVFTGNVFLTTSREAIDKIFFPNLRVPSFADSLASLSEEELQKSVIAGPGINTNLLEFDFSFGIEKSSGYVLKLKLLETNSLFEQYYISKNTIGTIAQNILKDIESRSAGEWGNNLEQRAKAEISVGAYNNSNQIYFGFGEGSDLTTWAGPFVANLITAELNLLEDGIKEVTFEFQAEDAGFLRNEVELENNKFFNNAINRYNFLLTSNDIKIRSEVIVDNYQKCFDGGTFNAIVVNLLKDYIWKVSKQESIVILPNLSYLLNESKFDYKRENFSDFLTEILGLDSTLFDTKTNSLPSPSIDVISELNKFNRFYDKNSFKVSSLSIWVQTGTTDSPDATESLPDYFFPLKFIGDSLAKTVLNLKLSGKFNLKIFSECDIRLLKLWKKYGLISNSDRPVLVIGDNDTITKLLYNDNSLSIEDIKFPSIESNLVYPELFQKLKNSQGYREDYYDIFSKYQQNSSFGEVVDLADELALPESTRGLLRFANTPIFRYNLSNPNVLALSISNNQVYRSAYDIGFKQRYIGPLINSTQKALLSQGDELIRIINKEASNLFKGVYFGGNGIDKSTIQYKLFNLVDKTSNLITSNQLKSFTTVLDYITSELNNEDITTEVKLGENTYSKEKIQTLLAASLSNRITTADTKPYIEVDSISEAASLNENIIEQLDKLTFAVNIRTLPYFHITRCPTISLLLGITNSIIGFARVKQKAWYSGIYGIKGFRHFISSSEMYSEFALNVVKNSGMVNNSAVKEADIIK